MKFILAEKKEMTQQYASDGTVIPVTRVVAGPCVVVQAKTDKTDGYTAVQVGFGQAKRLSKPLAGHLKNLGQFRYLKEFRISAQQAQQLSVGDKITAKVFEPGDVVKVSGTSKGKGFQGVVKRHGFSGSPASHGHKDQLRMPGSIGAGGEQHVKKGKRMGGRMGGSQVTIANLEIIKVSPDTNEIFIKGAVPGPRNNLLMLSGAGDLILEVETKTETKTEQATTPVEVVEKTTQTKSVAAPAEVKSEVKQEASAEVKAATK